MMRFLRACVVVLGVVLIPALQRTYDAAATRVPRAPEFTPLSLITSFDIGLHAAVAAMKWVGVRSDMPLVPEGHEKLDYDIQLINDLDPKFAQPYYFSVIVLPLANRHPYRIQAALTVGERGLMFSEPDWRIPFYLGAVYHVYLRDRTNAAKYFDIAARTSDIPDTVRRFAINYGIAPRARGETKEIWTAIGEGASDKETRVRADMHVRHFEIVELLQDAVGAYYRKTGMLPGKIEDVVSAGVLPEIPASPFGMEFFLYENGVVGIKPPSE